MGVFGVGGYFPDDYPPVPKDASQAAPGQTASAGSLLQLSSNQGPAGIKTHSDGLELARALLIESDGLQSRALANKLRLESLHQHCWLLTMQQRRR